MALPILNTLSDLLRQITRRKFSRSIRNKFPVQTERHFVSPVNALWMLRNIPTSPLSSLEKRELSDVAKLNFNRRTTWRTA